MKIIALIPARGGSKGIPRKNVILYKNKPLIAHTIELALKCKYIEEVYVSTDDKEIADVSRKYGAEVPFKRPDEISGDTALDIDVFKHFVEWYESKEDYIIVHLRATYPNRSPSGNSSTPQRGVELLDRCIETFLQNSDYDSLRTVVACEKSPFKMYTIGHRCEKENLIPLFKEISSKETKIKEPYNACRQMLPQCYLHNGCIDIVKKSTIMKGSMTGDKIYPIVMVEEPNQCDIDTIKDLK